MSAPEQPQPTHDYQVVAQRARTTVDDATNTVTEGMQLTVKDLQSGVIFPIFVPNDVYYGAGADALIREKLQRVRDVHALGRIGG